MEITREFRRDKKKEIVFSLTKDIFGFAPPNLDSILEAPPEVFADSMEKTKDDNTGNTKSAEATFAVTVMVPLDALVAGFLVDAETEEVAFAAKSENGADDIRFVDVPVTDRAYNVLLVVYRRITGWVNDRGTSLIPFRKPDAGKVGGRLVVGAETETYDLRKLLDRDIPDPTNPYEWYPFTGTCEMAFGDIADGDEGGDSGDGGGGGGGDDSDDGRGGGGGEYIDPDKPGGGGGVVIVVPPIDDIPLDDPGGGVD